MLADRPDRVVANREAVTCEDDKTDILNWSE